ncbi:UNVERIFIED_CONTAM: hypothetical protein FKN15_049630 [Acipenser sinensis]
MVHIVTSNLSACNTLPPMNANFPKLYPLDQIFLLPDITRFHSALKMKIKEVKKEKGDRKLIAAQKKKKVLKMGVLRKKDLKNLVLYIKNGANCPCHQLDSLNSNFLIMGRKVDQQLLLMSIHKWEKKSKELKIAVKYMKSQQCPTYHTVFQ